MVKELRDKMDALGDVCAAFRETEKLIVYDQQIFPNAYLYDELVDFFRQQVRDLSRLSKNQPKLICRPTLYMSHLGHLLRAYNHVGQHLNIEIEHMVQHFKNLRPLKFLLKWFFFSGFFFSLSL